MGKWNEQKAQSCQTRHSCSGNGDSNAVVPERTGRQQSAFLLPILVPSAPVLK